MLISLAEPILTFLCCLSVLVPAFPADYILPNKDRTWDMDAPALEDPLLDKDLGRLIDEGVEILQNESSSNEKQAVETEEVKPEEAEVEDETQKALQQYKIPNDVTIQQVLKRTLKDPGTYNVPRKRTSHLMDKFLVLLHNSLSNGGGGGGGRMPAFAETTEVRELDIPRKEGKGVHYPCYFNIVTCFRK